MQLIFGCPIGMTGRKVKNMKYELKRCEVEFERNPMYWRKEELFDACFSKPQVTFQVIKTFDTLDEALKLLEKYHNWCQELYHHSIKYFYVSMYVVEEFDDEGSDYWIAKNQWITPEEANELIQGELNKEFVEWLSKEELEPWEWDYDELGVFMRERGYVTA